MARRKEPSIPDAILDQLLGGADARTAFDQGGLLDALKKALTERALNAEMDHHLAGEDGAGNSRNGYGRKTVVTDTGKLNLAVPRDRQASFDPQLIAKSIAQLKTSGLRFRSKIGSSGTWIGVESHSEAGSARTGSEAVTP